MSSACYRRAGKGTGIKTVRRVVVLGVGNELLKDEGVGVHVVRALERMLPPLGIDLEVVDGGTSPDVWYLVERADKLVVVDAVKGGGQPGSVYRFTTKDVSVERKAPVSLHETGLLENLSILEQLVVGPKDTVIIVVEPEEIALGLELSPEMQRMVPETVELVLREALGTSGAEPGSSSVWEEGC